MSEFGSLLREYRTRAADPERGGRLTQERLGALIGAFLDDMGYTGAAISYWESGQTSISQEDRRVLLALIAALHAGQGIRSPDEANALLLAGDYRPLDAAEIEHLNPAWRLELPAAPAADAARSWDRLRRFLPADLFTRAERAPRERLADLVLPHLVTLLQTVATYLPRHRALTLLRQPVAPDDQVAGEFLEGSLLFADISGFTQLVESLRKQAGKESAEQIVELINRYLDNMLHILHKYDGHLIKFGGDAMLCLFPGAAPGALAALAAAAEMQEMMTRRFKEIPLRQEVIRLDMKMGNHAGTLFAASVGNADHMEYFLTGSAVERTARAESTASRGQIVISAETYRLVQGRVTARPLPDKPDFYEVVDVERQDTNLLTSAWLQIEDEIRSVEGDVWAIVDRLDAMVPYLPAVILPQIVYAPTGQIEGQYRQVTVVFVNYMGSSDIIDAYGPEAAPDIVRELNTFFRAMQEEVAYYGGVINKVDLYDPGDKLMVLFGAPMAHERDARRAALTALAMRRALQHLSSPAARFLSLRIGIHTGTAFAGNVGSARNHRREYTVMGDTVNLSARLMSGAGEGEILVSPQLWAQIAGDFEGQELAPMAMKGIADLVRPVRVDTAVNWQSRQRTHAPLQSALVGRSRELAELERRFDSLIFGGGKQLLAVVGPAGVGKTRLLQDWRQRSSAAAGAAHPVTWITGAARSFGQRASGVFVSLLESLLGILPEDGPEQRWRKLSVALRARFSGSSTGWLPIYTRHLAYLGTFLNLDLATQNGLPEHVRELDPEALQLQMRLALLDILQHAARQQPLLLLLEDLHWADAASLDLLQFLVDQTPDDLPLLVCLVFRPGLQTAVWRTWHGLERSYADFTHAFSLAELADDDGRALLRNLLHSDAIPAEFERRILKETDGNPLYLEEVLYSLIRTGVLQPADAGWRFADVDLARIEVPDSLYQIIQSRIDDLDFASPGARRALWLAAILGMRFAEDELKALFARTGQDEHAFWRHLRALRNADMLRRTRAAADGSQELPGYQFRHGLLQQVAYENMLFSRRREFHAWAGELIETAYAADLSPHLDALALHFDRGAQWPKAFRYHVRVALRDARGYANESARQHLRRALEVAPDGNIPPLELAQAQLELGKVLALTGDLDAALAALQAAYDLFGAVPGDVAARQRAETCYEIGRIHESRGGRANLEAALSWRDAGMALLPAIATAVTARLHALGALAAMRLGDWAAAETAAQRCLAIADGIQDRWLLSFAHRLLAMLSRFQGNPAEALRHVDASARLSQEMGDLVSLAKDYANRGVCALELGDWSLAERAYLDAEALLAQTGDRYQLAMTCANLGDLYFHLGQVDDGMRFARRGLELFQALASVQGQVLARVVLATLRWRQAAYADALADLAAARALDAAQEIPEFQIDVGRWHAQAHLSAGDLAACRAELDALPADLAHLGLEAEAVQRLRGQLLAAEGDPAGGRRLLEASLARLTGGGSSYQLALTQLALAELLAPEPARRDEAIHLTQQAEALFTALGASLDAAAASELLRHLGG